MDDNRRSLFEKDTPITWQAKHIDYFLNLPFIGRVTIQELIKYFPNIEDWDKEHAKTLISNKRSHKYLPKDIPVLNELWSGDVWKVAFEIIETKGLDFKIISIDHGVGVIKVNDKKTKFKDLSNELKNKQYNFYFDNLKKLPIVEWNEAVDWISKDC